MANGDNNQSLPTDIDLSVGLPSAPESIKVAKDTLKNIDLTAGLSTVSESTYVQDPFAKINEGSSFSEVVEAVHHTAIDNLQGPASNFIKEAYNKSIKGTMVQVMTGKKMFDVPLNDNGRLFDLGTQALSLFVPTKENIALAAVGGGFGGKVAQKLGGEKLVNFIGNQMVKNKVMPKRALPSFTKNLTRIATTESAYFASFDGLYGGAMDIKEQVLNSDYDLSKIKYLKKMVKNPGISDHTTSLKIGNYAKQFGVQYYEKHVKLNETIKSPDDKFSITVKQLAIYIDNITKQPFKYNPKKIINTKKNKLKTRKIFSSNFLKKNTVLNKNHIKFYRSENGIESIYLKNFLGKKLKNDLMKNDLINHKDISN